MAKNLDRVIGIVLIDPGNEYLTQEILLTFSEDEWPVLDSLIHTPNKNSSIGFQSEINARRSWDNYMRTLNIKSSILIESARQNDAILMTSEVIQIKQKLNRDLKNELINLKILTTTESGHFIQIDEPHLVIKAILELLEKN